MAYTWGGAATIVQTGPNGSVLQGREWEVWTAKNGSRITALLDHSGVSIGNVVTSGTDGRLMWRINSETWPAVWLHRAAVGTFPEEWWGPFLANEVMPKVPQAIEDAADALVAATDAATALGEITMPLASHATAAQLNGTADVGPAIQSAIDALPAAGGRITVPAGSVLWSSGATVPLLKSNVTLDLLGSVFKKTNSFGYYTGLAANRVDNVKIINGYFQGDLDNGGGLCALSCNRATNVTIENCEFVGCIIGGHALDFGGCDGIRVIGCTFRGFKPGAGGLIRTEAINVDISAAGSLSFPDGGQCDGSLSRNVTVRDCQFLPLTVGATTYPAPNPVGAHATHEGHHYENITLDNLYIEDPVSDPTTADYGDNGSIRGLIHFPTVINFHASNIRVKANTARTVRVIHLQALSVGALDSSNWNTAPTSGTFSEPTVCRDVFIRDVVVEGLTPASGESDTLNPVIVVSGVTGGYNTNVNVSGSVTNCGGPASILVQKGRRVTVDLFADSSPGAVLNSVDEVSVSGRTNGVTAPVKLDAVSNFLVGPFVAKHTVTQLSLVRLSGGTDNGSIFGTRRDGYGSLYTGASPSNVQTAANS